MDEDLEATKSVLKSCLQQQIEEFDMLSSIFCNPGELKIDDHSILADINEFLEDKLVQLNQHLYYTICLTVCETKKLEIQFDLPHLYPLIETVSLTLRTTFLSNNKSAIENEVKQKIMDFVETLDKSTVYIYQVIVWIQENCENLFANSQNDTAESKSNEFTEDQLVEMERLWIYSHHLKSKTKRQEIVKLAKELELSGFSRPGKPGIICVEGVKENTQEFWKCVRQWPWQRITIRKSEVKTKPFGKISNFQKFTNFREELFTDIGDDGSEQPMNMSLFMKFLEQHNCIYIKKDLFGIE